MTVRQLKDQLKNVPGRYTITISTGDMPFGAVINAEKETVELGVEFWDLLGAGKTHT